MEGETRLLQARRSSGQFLRCMGWRSVENDDGKETKVSYSPSGLSFVHNAKHYNNNSSQTTCSKVKLKIYRTDEEICDSDIEQTYLCRSCITEAPMLMHQVHNTHKAQNLELMP